LHYANKVHCIFFTVKTLWVGKIHELDVVWLASANFVQASKMRTQGKQQEVMDGLRQFIKMRRLEEKIKRN